MMLFMGVFLGWKAGKCREKDYQRKELYKYKSYFYTLVRLYHAGMEGKTVDDLLRQRGIEKIAIYGMGELGTILYEELKDTGITVAYGIDQSVSRHPEITVIQKENIKEETDAIIVTIPFAYESVKKDLEKLVSCPIISLEHLLYEVSI